ncbi:DUF4097 family beta strand repeat-containing protein [Oceanobacillus chungangensis]|uniref:DUF4097 domain-containing protein n=1 Tax=Oceanobacillus chungangensis TaxID=1229152 RepID=A0A3D8PHP4_9BACI|nr:DUF4097 family beta strand repeat-containing protein [Oceanobacillus chungangensis]RDW15007.1 hypothetical protein CWR45_19340 [Oceanobacillus chungangensis]
MLSIKKMSIVALVLLLVGVTGSLLTVNAKIQSEPIEEERIIQDENFTNIDIKVDNAEVEIIPAGNQAAKVELTGGDKKSRAYTFDVGVQENTLAVHLNEKNLKFYNFDFLDSALALKVYVPEKMYDSLRIVAANGNVKAEEIEVAAATVETINGTIDLNDLETATLNVSSGNGKILLQNIEGDILGNVINGKITFVTDHLDRNIDFENLNGKIEIQTLKEPTNSTINVDVAYGKVNIFGDSSRNALFGKGENLIKLSTLNGGITVTK